MPSASTNVVRVLQCSSPLLQRFGRSFCSTAAHRMERAKSRSNGRIAILASDWSTITAVTCPRHSIAPFSPRAPARISGSAHTRPLRPTMSISRRRPCATPMQMLSVERCAPWGQRALATRSPGRSRVAGVLAAPPSIGTTTKEKPTPRTCSRSQDGRSRGSVVSTSAASAIKTMSSRTAYADAAGGYGSRLDCVPSTPREVTFLRSFVSSMDTATTSHVFCGRTRAGCAFVIWHHPPSRSPGAPCHWHVAGPCSRSFPLRTWGRSARLPLVAVLPVPPIVDSPSWRCISRMASDSCEGSPTATLGQVQRLDCGTATASGTSRRTRRSITVPGRRKTSCCTSDTTTSKSIHGDARCTYH